MRKDYFVYTKLALLDMARYRIALSDKLDNEEVAKLLNEVDTNYIQTVLETDDVSFKRAQEMIEDISSSYEGLEAQEKIIRNLNFNNYEYKKTLEDVRVSKAVIDVASIDRLYENPSNTVSIVKKLAYGTSEEVEKEFEAVR